MLSKNAIGNLKNRYKAVLAKCNLINVFSSLALATMLVCPILVNEALAVTVDASATGRTGGIGHTHTNGSTAANGNNGTSGAIDGTAHGNRILDGGNGGIGYDNALVGVGGDGSSLYGAQGGNGGGGGGQAIVSGSHDGGVALANGGAQSSSNSNGGGGGGGGGVAQATENTRTLDSTSPASVWAGFATSLGGKGGKASHVAGAGGNGGQAIAGTNSVTIQNSANIQNIYSGVAIAGGGNGGESFNYKGGNGGNGGNAVANENTINISDGSVVNAYAGVAISKAGSGGYGDTIPGTDGTNGTATAIANNIIISGGTVSGYIIGGMVLGDSNSRAENNRVTLSNAPNLAGADIRGGAILDAYTLNTADINNITFSTTPLGALSPNVFTGNALYVNKYRGTGTISNIAHFEKYSFILPSDTSANSTVLTVGNLFLGDGSSQVASIGNVSIESGHNLQQGQTVILIDATSIDGVIANNGSIVTSDSTTFTQQEWRINQDDTNRNITATFLSEQLTPTPTPTPTQPSTSTQSRAEIVASSQTGSASTTLYSATGVLVGNAIPTAQTATQNAAQGGSSEIVGSLENNGMSAGSTTHIRSTWAPFAVLQGGYNSFDSGVETDVTSLSFVGGIAHNSYYDNSELLLGAFVETGTGSYNSSAGTVDSDGNVNYIGGGLFARYELYTQNGSPYFEASARLGTLNTDYNTNDIIDITTGSGVNYETNSKYYGIHVGAGYIWNINNQWNLDMSAKYFWTHQESINKEIAGDNFNFDFINSHIVRVGATANYAMLDNDRYSFSPYVGFHYEHEFDSEARASVENISIPNSASLEGGTAVLSLGATFAHMNGFSLNAKVEGSLGERDGVTGMIEAKYTF